MKSIQSFVFVTLCVSFGSCDVPGTLIGLSRLASRATFPQCENSLTPFCDDCNTLVKCQNSATDPPTVTCRTEYPDRPYCVDGACTSAEPKDCAPKFTCTGPGYYPNPLNCSRYHLCAAAGSVGNAALMYECPKGFAYNPTTTMCKNSTTAADCAVIDCSVDPTGSVVYPADNRLYADCNRGQDPVMMRCPTYFVYGLTARKCVFHCPREGRIAFPSSVTKYYECYLKDSIYYYTEGDCSIITGYRFNQAAEQCMLPVG